MLEELLEAFSRLPGPARSPSPLSPSRSHSPFSNNSNNNNTLHRRPLSAAAHPDTHQDAKRGMGQALQRHDMTHMYGATSPSRAMPRALLFERPQSAPALKTWEQAADAPLDGLPLSFWVVPKDAALQASDFTRAPVRSRTANLLSNELYPDDHPVVRVSRDGPAAHNTASYPVLPHWAHQRYPEVGGRVSDGATPNFASPEPPCSTRALQHGSLALECRTPPCGEPLPATSPDFARECTARDWADPETDSRDGGWRGTATDSDTGRWPLQQAHNADRGPFEAVASSVQEAAALRPRRSSFRFA